MSVIVYGVRLLPGDVDLHREERRGNMNALRRRAPLAGVPSP
jgi:hypothetical protein